MTRFQRFKEAHRFFVRESQHYVLGNWFCYVKSFRKRAAYVIAFPRAYVRFMRYSLFG